MNFVDKTTVVEAATQTGSYTLVVNPLAEAPLLSGTIGSASEGGLVTLALSDTAADGDDTLGTVTISGLPSDLSGFNGGSYTAASGTWSGTGPSAAQGLCWPLPAGSPSRWNRPSAPASGR